MNALKLVARVLLPLVVLGLGGAIAYMLADMREEPTPDPPEKHTLPVEVVVARSGDVQLTVAAQGVVVPRSESAVAAEVPGRVTWVSPALASGGFFEADEALVRIDASELELGVVRAELDLASSERALSEVQADADVARRDWEQHGEGEASPLVLREPQLAEARARVAVARATLEEARRDVERATVRAPYAGRVRAKRVDVGSYVQTGTPVAELYAVDYAEVRLPIPDADVAFLELPHVFRNGDEPNNAPRAMLRTRFAGADHVWEARVLRTEGELSARNRMVVAVARVDDPYGRSEGVDRPPLAIGMFVEAELEGRIVRDAVVLPRVALLPGGRVLVVDDESRLRIRDVEVVQARVDDVVIASGVEDGERVVVSPVELPVDGTLVRILGGGEGL
jgi:RND family efflux transporter MFP subunit